MFCQYFSNTPKTQHFFCLYLYHFMHYYTHCLIGIRFSTYSWWPQIWIHTILVFYEYNHKLKLVLSNKKRKQWTDVHNVRDRRFYCFFFIIAGQWSAWLVMKFLVGLFNVIHPNPTISRVHIVIVHDIYVVEVLACCFLFLFCFVYFFCIFEAGVNRKNEQNFHY